jgi:hypothetical protein
MQELKSIPAEHETQRIDLAFGLTSSLALLRGFPAGNNLIHKEHTV